MLILNNKGLTLFVLISILGMLILSAPHFLLYSDIEKKSDIGIIFIGPQFHSRLDRAFSSVSQEYINDIFIPAYGVYVNKENFKTLVEDRENIISQKNKVDLMRDLLDYGFYENTHLEILLAKIFMDTHKLKSAQFISSPYHIRRIKIITDYVFNQSNYNITFISAKNKQSSHLFWWIKKSDSQWILSEYIKIIWFYFYKNRIFHFFISVGD